MRVKDVNRSKSIRNLFLVLATAVLLSISIFTFVSADVDEASTINASPFFTFTFSLDPAQSISPSAFSSGNRDIDFSFDISGPEAAEASLTISNGSNVQIWDGYAKGGEELWGNTTLTNGNNPFVIENTGSDTFTFTLKLYDIPEIQAPTPTLEWGGTAAPAGMNSEIEADFPVSGLYTFDFTVSSNGRYEFKLGSDDIQRTVTGNDSVTLFVAAGVQTMQIVQDSTASALVDWQVDIVYSGSAADPLPYSKSNDDIDEEWLPIHLAQAAEVNMVITATGTANDQLDVSVVGATPQLSTIEDADVSVYAGETTWVTFDLPAGTSAINLTTPDDLMSYALEISVIPATDHAYSGTADPDGQNSKIRLNFDTAGLYDFSFGDNGRYQFLLNNNSASHIQKTVEGSNSVTYYVPQGTHDLIIDQDTNGGAEWSVDISLNSASNNALPFIKSGGEIGGTGNDFTEEWLPISLSSAATVNMSINAEDGSSDSFSVEVYQSGSSSADYTLSQVLGTEEQWTNFDLSAGINRLKIVADGGNTDPLSYSLVISAIPSNGNMAWDGNVLDTGLNPSVKVNFPTTGLYRFTIDATDGFANLVLDDNVITRVPGTPTAAENLGNGYDIQVQAGVHEIFVVHDTNFAQTTWSASVAPASPEQQFFEFSGNLGSGETVTPIYPVPSGTLDFNFSLTVNGDDIDLAITDGNSSTVWSGTALDGETLWGTGTLVGDNDLTLTNNGGSAADVELKLYHIPTAGYVWDGLADAAGENSEIRVNFPQDGLYTFDTNADTGRYQFLLDSDFIQKTVETGSSSVTYFVPAGMQYLNIVQDTGSGSDWDVTISNVGAGQDSLPYSKSGGDIGGSGNDFDMEWLPIEMDTATAVNIATTITGADNNDSVQVNILDESDATLGSVTVNVGETTWTTLDLPAGTSRLEMDATGNNDTVAYEVEVLAIPSAASYAWDGAAIDSGTNSHIRVSFPSSGIYSFDYAIDSGNGRYQFLVNDEFVQKTVESDGAVDFYIPAGVHDLYLDQDSIDGADWSLDISGPSAAQDSLPYAKMGGDIGGAGNDFTEEWLPVHVGTDTLINALITVSGDAADSVQVEVWNAVTKTETINAVYGTESLWATFTLPADGRVNVIANGNSSSVSYEIEMIEVPSPSFSWSGTSLDGTLNSIIQINMQVGGTYRIQGDYIQGFASLMIDPSTVREVDAVESDLDFTVDMNAGLHTFVVAQGTGFATSTWVYTVTLESAYAPVVLSVSPDTVNEGTATPITINGQNFLDGAVVNLISGATVIPLTNVTYVSGGQLTATVPASVGVGVYTVEVINPDTQTAELPDALEVIPEVIGGGDYFIYLPTILRD